MIELRVDRVGVDPENGLAVVMLKDLEGKRILPIWIGALEASSIALAIEGVSPPRPMTHDLVKNLLEQFKARVAHVLINDLKDDTFFAQICLDVNNQTIELDARPSDGIALALRFLAPIFVSSKVMEAASISSSEDPTPPTVH